MGCAAGAPVAVQTQLEASARFHARDPARQWQGLAKPCRWRSGLSQAEPRWPKGPCQSNDKGLRGMQLYGDALHLLNDILHVGSGCVPVQAEADGPRSWPAARCPWPTGRGWAGGRRDARHVQSNQDGFGLQVVKDERSRVWSQREPVRCAPSMSLSRLVMSSSRNSRSRVISFEASTMHRSSALVMSTISKTNGYLQGIQEDGKPGQGLHRLRVQRHPDSLADSSQFRQGLYGSAFPGW